MQTGREVLSSLFPARFEERTAELRCVFIFPHKKESRAGSLFLDGYAVSSSPR